MLVVCVSCVSSLETPNSDTISIDCMVRQWMGEVLFALDGKNLCLLDLRSRLGSDVKMLSRRRSSTNDSFKPAAQHTEREANSQQMGSASITSLQSIFK